jgi:hypothetical protein
LKRFLSPAVVAAYDWIVVLDDDVDLGATDFRLHRMLSVMVAAHFKLAQPAHAQGSSTTFLQLFQVWGWGCASTWVCGMWVWVWWGEGCGGVRGVVG